ncbi:MAG: hypothetical protein B6D61_05300 [Bacteroidetes bacterium 4484_249]|nr:MAG: hypothetical protein B6D61_05300 [Bacteroidetes bacterium 4484_249]
MGKQIKNKCLIVDDEHYFTMYLKILLEKSGFEVTDCLSAKEALEVLKYKSFDLIISDIQMPEMDGFDLLSEIKNNEKTKQIPVLIVSNMDDCKYTERAFKLGAIGYIKKPFLKHHVIRILDIVKNGN